MNPRATRGGYLYASDGTRVNEADILRNATDLTGAQISMDEVHAFVNRGIVYDLSAKITLGASATVYLTGQTNGAVVHFIRENYIADLGGIEFRLLEGVTFTGGTAMSPLNRNRTSSNVATLQVKSGSTVTNTGTELYLVGIPKSTSPFGRIAQSGSDTVPWVLDSETNYAIEIKNLSADVKTVYAELSWYEIAV